MVFRKMLVTRQKKAPKMKEDLILVYDNGDLVFLFLLDPPKANHWNKGSTQVSCDMR